MSVKAVCLYRSSETVRRQETSDSGGLIENLLWKSTTDRNRQVNQSDLRRSSQTAKLSILKVYQDKFPHVNWYLPLISYECTNACMQPLVGVCGKVVARSGSLGLNDRKKPITGVTLRESLPHPSKLKKKRRKQSKHQPSVRQSQQGFDVMAHVAHLRRKQAEFNWLPSYEKDDISSSSDLVEEESFPPGSTGPQCVPSTPTLLSSESFELHRPPTSLNTKGRANMDLFNAYYQVVHS
ncbi:hypothetical protein AWC38_SpisGene6167 [Stylophora pistillata]|uniref:Uncharacterized protein n=1 Tax=Stylophora pistillata TaxID=50429 RepID=A0A2B4SKM7_STYPI|nr:hypothetical protein AWC38_SpisGene6167 [Stylophora pistillata]